MELEFFSAWGEKDPCVEYRPEKGSGVGFCGCQKNIHAVRGVKWGFRLVLLIWTRPPDVKVPEDQTHVCYFRPGTGLSVWLTTSDLREYAKRIQKRKRFKDRVDSSRHKRTGHDKLQQPPEAADTEELSGSDDEAANEWSLDKWNGARADQAKGAQDDEGHDSECNASQGAQEFEDHGSESDDPVGFKDESHVAERVQGAKEFEDHGSESDDPGGFKDESHVSGGVPSPGQNP